MFYIRFYNGLSFCFLLFFFCKCTTKQSFSYENNLGFELINSNKPIKWSLHSNEAAKEYSTFLDSTNKKTGNYSICLSKIGSSPDKFGFFTNDVPAVHHGKSITLSAYIKTQNVSEGYRGFGLGLKEQMRV